MSTVRLTLDGLVRYNGRLGQFSFIMHRLTGLGTLLFLLIHILDTSTVYFFPSLYEHAIDLYRSTPFMLGEIALVFAVIYHGINGLRIAYFDMIAPGLWKHEYHNPTALITLAISIVLWLPAAFMMGRALLVHNYGLSL